MAEYKIRNIVNMAVKPACAVTSYKFGELIVQITEITLKLPLLFRSGFFTVRDTAPGAERPARIAGITVRTPQISPCDNGQDAGKPLAVQNAVKGKPSEISSVLFAFCCICHRSRVCIKLFFFVNHGAPPVHEHFLLLCRAEHPI